MESDKNLCHRPISKFQTSKRGMKHLEVTYLDCLFESLENAAREAERITWVLNAFGVLTLRNGALIAARNAADAIVRKSVGDGCQWEEGSKLTDAEDCWDEI